MTEKKTETQTTGVRSAGAERFNLTDLELDDLLKQAMREQGYTTFINYQGEEEPL